MKLKDLIEKINDDVEIRVNGKKEITKELQEAEIKRINVETSKKQLKGYSFEVGV